MQTFNEWKSWYEAHAEPADPIEGASLYAMPEQSVEIATKANSGYRVIERVSDNAVKIVFR